MWLQAIINELKQRIPGLVGIYQFGSSVPGTEHLLTPESDLDLAILGPQPLSALFLFELRSILEPLAGREVDLVDLKVADSVITNQVLVSGVLIYQSDPTALALFEVTAMAKYCNLNDERKEILEAIRKRDVSMPDDVIVGKAEIIERCLKRVSEIYAGVSSNLTHDLTKQDSILLNIQRACQASIDLAMRIIRVRSLSVPKESREAFKVLEASQLIPSALSTSLQKMVGFRNIAIHEYQVLDLKIVEAVIQHNLADLLVFTGLALKL